MDRRSVLKFLGLAPVAVAAAPAALAGSAGVGASAMGVAGAGVLMAGITPGEVVGNTINNISPVSGRAEAIKQIIKLGFKTGLTNREVRALMAELQVLERGLDAGDWVHPKCRMMKSWSDAMKRSYSDHVWEAKVRRVIQIKETLKIEHYNTDDHVLFGDLGDL